MRRKEDTEIRTLLGGMIGLETRGIVSISDILGPKVEVLRGRGHECVTHGGVPVEVDGGALIEEVRKGVLSDSLLGRSDKRVHAIVGQTTGQPERVVNLNLLLCGERDTRLARGRRRSAGGRG